MLSSSVFPQRALRPLGAGLLLGLMFESAALAQTTQGKIVGTVRDESGGVVPGATLRAASVKTGQIRTVLTDETGTYSVSELPPSEYDVTAEAPGFSRESIKGVALQVGQTARVDVTLKVGKVSEEISVTARSPVVQSEESSIGTVIEEKRVSDLPLNGRDFAQLAVLTPGAILRPSQSRNFSRTLTVQGTPPSKTEWLLDGVSNTEQLFEGVALTPSIDAIQEFKVQGNAFSAEYGRGGAVVNVAIKSGTNELHGTLFEFVRNDDLDARNFFFKDVEVLKRNQFGGTAGFPIVKDKVFFFGNYEGSRERRGRTFNSVVPSAAMRRGDFSGTRPIFNPFTTRRDAQGRVVRDRFANNQIPSSFFSPPAVFFLTQFIPLPNTPAGTFVQSPTDPESFDLSNFRADDHRSSNTTIYGRYSGMWRNRFINGAFPQNGGKSLDQSAHNVLFGTTRIFGPTVILEVKAGYARFHNFFANQGLGTNFTVQSGIGGFEEISKPFPGFPQFNFSGFTQFNGGQPSEPLDNPTNNYQLMINLGWTRGRHSFKFGTDLRKFNWLSTNSGRSRGEFDFRGIFTQDSQNPSTTGNDMADFLLGSPRQGIRTFVNDEFGWFPWNLHFYAQDDFQIHPKLTLNLGLRYEVNLWPAPLRGASASFDPSQGKVVAGVRSANCGCPFPRQIDPTVTRSTPVNLKLFPDLIVPWSPGVPWPNPTFRQFDGRDFAPRVGLAWRPFGNTRSVVRAAYGIFYLLPQGNAATNSNIPFRAQETLINDANNPNPRLLSDFFGGAAFGSFITFPGNITVIDPRPRVPYLQQWNVAVQHELAGNVALEIAYIGNKGTRLEFSRPFNIPLPGRGAIQPRRPFTRFGAGAVEEDSASSIYHALEVKLERRFSRSLSLLGSYNFGRSIDLASTDNDASGNGVQDPMNLRAQRGRSVFDVQHRFVGSWLYELPFGSGKAFGGNVAGWSGRLISGWQVNGIVVLQSGLPYTPVLGIDNANIGLSTDRPDRLPVSAARIRGLPGEFNPAAFPAPAPLNFGNSGRNILEQDGITNIDFAVFKNTKLAERWTLQFRAEFFNLFNHPNFGRPVTNIRSPNAGQVLTASNPREIQFGLKLIW